MTRILLHDAEPSPFDQIEIIDAGNIDLPPTSIVQALTRIEAAMNHMVE